MPSIANSNAATKQEIRDVVAMTVFSVLTVNAATPTIGTLGTFKTANTVATTYTNFLGGYDGQRITIVIDDVFTTISSSLFGNVGNDWKAPLGDTITFTYDGAAWNCQANSRTNFYLDSYGALGDGSTNDTPAYVLALAAVSAAGGGTLVFTPGKDYVMDMGNSTIHPDNLTVIAYGATIRAVNAATTAICVKVRGTGVGSEAENIHWYGGLVIGMWDGGANWVGPGIVTDQGTAGSQSPCIFSQLKNSSVNNLTVHAACDDGISGTQNINFSVNNCIVDKSGETGIYFTFSEGITYNNSTICDNSLGDWADATLRGGAKLRDCVSGAINGLFVYTTIATADPVIVNLASHNITMNNLTGIDVARVIDFANPVTNGTTITGVTISNVNALARAAVANTAFQYTNFPQSDCVMSNIKADGFTITRIGPNCNNIHLLNTVYNHQSGFPIYVDGLIIEEPSGTCFVFSDDSILKNVRWIDSTGTRVFNIQADNCTIDNMIMHYAVLNTTSVLRNVGAGNRYNNIDTKNTDLCLYDGSAIAGDTYVTNCVNDGGKSIVNNDNTVGIMHVVNSIARNCSSAAIDGTGEVHHANIVLDGTATTTTGGGARTALTIY